jgi:hypothetical protein
MLWVEKDLQPQLVLWTLTLFQSTQILFFGCNFPVTTRQILTRLNILGYNPARLGWKWVEFKKFKNSYVWIIATRKFNRVE